MEIRQLECFLACVRNRSLTLAAEELYMTQPHVSQIIKGLEQELGVQLFHRKAKGVELTEEGKRIYTYAVNAVKNARTVKDLCADVTPCIRVASNPSSHMAMLLTDYYRKQGTSGPVIEYFECGIEEMLQKIQEGACDLGFLFVPDDRQYALKSMLNRRYLEFVPLTKTDLVLYVQKDHPLYGTPRISPKKLLDVKLVQLEEDFFSLEDMLEESEAFRKGHHHLQKTVITNSGHMMIQMLQNTDLCNIGSYWLSALYRKYDFGRIRISGYEGRITFGYLKYKNRPLLPHMESFLEFLKAAVLQDNEQI